VLDDNYAYLVIDEVTQTAVVVDPSDPAVVLVSGIFNVQREHPILKLCIHIFHAYIFGTESCIKQQCDAEGRIDYSQALVSLWDFLSAMVRKPNHLPCLGTMLGEISSCGLDILS